MKLNSLKISGFKRLLSSHVYFGDATFLIGPNNSGKSSILQIVDILLSDRKSLNSDLFYCEIDGCGNPVYKSQEIVIEAEFINVPNDAMGWRGFKGRIFSYEPKDENDTGKKITYKKTYKIGGTCDIEIKSHKRKLKEKYSKCNTPKSYIDAGADEGQIRSIFTDESKFLSKISQRDKDKENLIDCIWEIDETEEVWDSNPGGIAGVVLSKLPHYLFIPADSSSHEISKSSGVLQKTLSELFKEVRDCSDHYKEAQKNLEKLAKELDPADRDSEFGKMMEELNSVLSSVFPESKIFTSANLSDPDSSLNPSFEIEMSSNIRTSVENQGTGIVRAAVFGLLRFRQQWISRKKTENKRNLVIGFEEPEIYLHPSAANQMRDLIYSLSKDGTQIIATTHSPYLIDLSRKPNQVLNRLNCTNEGSKATSFSVTDAYKKLENDDKSHVKMLLKMDDYASRAFFTNRVIIIEGDSEDIVIREVIKRMPNEIKLKVLCNSEVIKARGKASIIGFSKYLKSLGVEIFVIHDRDKGVENAEKFNKPILDAVGNPKNVLVLHECIEDVLGYTPPSSEKPFRAYEKTQNWGDEWRDVPMNLKEILSKAFDVDLVNVE